MMHLIGFEPRTPFFGGHSRVPENTVPLDWTGLDWTIYVNLNLTKKFIYGKKYSSNFQYHKIGT